LNKRVVGFHLLAGVVVAAVVVVALAVDLDSVADTSSWQKNSGKRPTSNIRYVPVQNLEGFFEFVRKNVFSQPRLAMSTTYYIVLVVN
jgi:hypothetical protein